MKFNREQLIQAGYRENSKGVWSPAGGERPRSVPKLESGAQSGSERPDAAQKDDQARSIISDPVRIEVVSYRAVFCDADNLASKWFIDTLVTEGVIDDDNPKFVESVTFRQVKCKRLDEKTVLKIFRS